MSSLLNMNEFIKTLLVSLTGAAIGADIWMIGHRVREFLHARKFVADNAARLMMDVGVLLLVAWFLEIELKVPADLYTWARQTIQVALGLGLTASGFLMMSIVERRKALAHTREA